MADNYLEKKMEEHRSGKAAVLPRRRTPSGGKPGTATFALAVHTAFVSGCENDMALAGAVLAAFGRAGVTTGFACVDLAAGRLMAQSTATRHYPLAADKALGMFGHADMTVCIGAACVDVETAGRRRAVVRGEGCGDDVFGRVLPELLLFLSLPYSGCVVGDRLVVMPDGTVQ